MTAVTMATTRSGCRCRGRRGRSFRPSPPIPGSRPGSTWGSRCWWRPSLAGSVRGRGADRGRHAPRRAACRPRVWRQPPTRRSTRAHASSSPATTSAPRSSGSSHATWRTRGSPGPKPSGGAGAWRACTCSCSRCIRSCPVRSPRRRWSWCGAWAWACGSMRPTTVAYPLITRLVDLSFNPRTGAAEVRPRDLDPRLELDFYAAVDRPGRRAGRAAGARVPGPCHHDAVAVRAGQLRAPARDRQALPGLGGRGRARRHPVRRPRGCAARRAAQGEPLLGAVRAPAQQQRAGAGPGEARQGGARAGRCAAAGSGRRTGERAGRAERSRSSCRHSAVFPPERPARSTCASPSRSTTSRCAWCSCSRRTTAWWCRGRRAPARRTPSPTSSATGWRAAAACW